MKNLRISEFEGYLLQEALKHYKASIAKEEFPDKSIVTKDYIEMMVSQLEEKLSGKTIKEKIREFNATTKIK